MAATDSLQESGGRIRDDITALTIDVSTAGCLGPRLAYGRGMQSERSEVDNHEQALLRSSPRDPGWNALLQTWIEKCFLPAVVSAVQRLDVRWNGQGESSESGLFRLPHGAQDFVSEFVSKVWEKLRDEGISPNFDPSRSTLSSFLSFSRSLHQLRGKALTYLHKHPEDGYRGSAAGERNDSVWEQLPAPPSSSTSGEETPSSEVAPTNLRFSATPEAMPDRIVYAGVQLMPRINWGDDRELTVRRMIESRFLCEAPPEGWSVLDLAHQGFAELWQRRIDAHNANCFALKASARRIVQEQEKWRRAQQRRIWCPLSMRWLIDHSQRDRDYLFTLKSRYLKDLASGCLLELEPVPWKGSVTDVELEDLT